MAQKTKTLRTGNSNQNLSNKSKGPDSKNSKAPSRPPATLAVAKRGVKSSADFAQFMSCLMQDLIEGTIESQTANAACNAGGKLLRIVELQMRHAKNGGVSDLMLAAHSTSV